MADHVALRRWIAENRGFVHPDVEVTFTAAQGHALRVAAGRTIASGTVVARCSTITSLSVLNALHTPPFSCRGTRFPPPFVDGDSTVVQCFFLVEQWLLGERSWWAPYLKTLPLPTAIGEMILDEADIPWLRGTPLEKGLTEQITSLKKRFMAGNHRLRQLKWPRALQGGYTWPLFMWAFAIFASRSFTSDVLTDTLPADKASRLGRTDPDHMLLARLFDDGFPVLLPLLDLLNYRPGTRVEWQSGLNDVGLRVLDALESGQEVCNNYGPKANESLLLGYGFAIPDNPFDYYAVGFKVPEDSPLAEARHVLSLASPRRRDFHYHIVNAQHPQAAVADWLELSLFSLDLFDSISVLSANTRELNGLAVVSKRVTFDSYPERFGRPRRQRNILQTLFQLHVECSNRIALLTGGFSPVTAKQANIEVYRAGQLIILETAALLCRYCLLKAASTDSKFVLRDAAAAQRLDESSRPVLNLQTLLGKEAATTCQTLFTSSEVIEYLPKPLADFVQKAITTANVAAQHYPEDIHPSDILEKTKFAIILATLRHVHATKSVRLPRRFRAWMRDLQRWYAFDEDYWNAPTEDFVPVQTALAASEMSDDSVREILTDPHYLCWGWNVQHEEGMFCETDTTETGLRPVKYRLCIPLKRKRPVENGAEAV